VEGLSRTLLPATSLVAHSQRIDPDGKPADACTGTTAAAALQQATHGRWTAGKYAGPSLGYPVVAVKGESHAFSSAYYWSFWINGQAATTGICGAALHAGDRVLFFPQCTKSAAAQCPSGQFNPPVLALTGPSRGRTGRPVTISVRALDNASGKPSTATDATVTAAGKSAHANKRGQAKLRFARAGRYVIVATAPDSVRDEMTIVVG
jgi:uncharacterized protein DUF4430